MADEERAAWEGGRVSGAVYEASREHVAFLNEAYAIHSQSNPLHLDVWPSAAKFEAEIVSMTAAMLGARRGRRRDLRHRHQRRHRVDHARDARLPRLGALARGIEAPEMVLPETAHAAFDKAAQTLGMVQRKLPITDGFVADVDAAREAIGPSTAVVVGSSPAFPHGLVDPIAELSELARAAGAGFHSDACLGGFLLPWAARLGYDVPPFDFRLPGVTSMSADTHKFGYAAKGTSVVLYRGAELRHHQYFTFTDWPEASTRRRRSRAAGPAGSARRAGRRCCRSASGVHGGRGADPRDGDADQGGGRRHRRPGADRRPALRRRVPLERRGARRLPRDGCDEPPRLEPQRPSPPGCVHFCVTLRHARSRGRGQLRVRPRATASPRSARCPRPRTPAASPRSTGSRRACPTARS